MTPPLESYLVTAGQMRELEARSVAEGATWEGLMAQAGRGVADHAARLLGGAPAGKRVLALVGPGNNGGDALVAARHLAEAGAAVALYVWKRRPDASDWSWQAARALGPEVVYAADDPDAAALRRLLAAADLALDGLLGVGVNRPLAPELARIVAAANDSGVPVVAIDVPTGLDADTGKVWGAAVNAGLTVATGLLKRGHRLGPAAAVGRIALAPIDLPASWEESMNTTDLSEAILRSLLPARPAESHKGTFGKALVVAGSYFYPGAAALAAGAATRSGAGLVTLACPRSIFGGTSASLREATYLPLPEPEPGALGEAAAEAVLEKLGAYDALLVGCGLGREEATGEFLRHLLGLGGTKRRLGVGFLSQLGREEQPKHRPGVGFRSGREAKPEPAAEKPAGEQHDPGSLPLVIDADGLNLLAGVEDWAAKLRERPAVLTPHPGEMARLLGVERIGEDAAEVAASAAADWGVVVVLKGARTVVAAPDGQVALHGAANAALATAGTGDVLSGLIVGLLAQGLAPFDAARLGVGLHGLAGRLLSDELGDRGVVAGDLLPRLPLAFRRLVG